MKQENLAVLQEEVKVTSDPLKLSCQCFDNFRPMTAKKTNNNRHNSRDAGAQNTPKVDKSCIVHPRESEQVHPVYISCIIWVHVEGWGACSAHAQWAMMMQADTSHVASVLTVLSNVTFKDSCIAPPYPPPPVFAQSVTRTWHTQANSTRRYKNMCPHARSHDVLAVLLRRHAFWGAWRQTSLNLHNSRQFCYLYCIFVYTFLFIQGFWIQG